MGEGDHGNHGGGGADAQHFLKNASPAPPPLFRRPSSTTGVDMNGLVRRISAGEVSADDFAKLVTETIVSEKG